MVGMGAITASSTFRIADPPQPVESLLGAGHNYLILESRDLGVIVSCLRSCRDLRDGTRLLNPPCSPVSRQFVEPR